MCADIRGPSPTLSRARDIGRIRFKLSSARRAAHFRADIGKACENALCLRMLY